MDWRKTSISPQGASEVAGLTIDEKPILSPSPCSEIVDSGASQGHVGALNPSRPTPRRDFGMNYDTKCDKQSVSFRAYGLPRPGGSKRAFVNPRTGRVVVTDDCKQNRTWREAVKAAYLAVCAGGGEPLAGPLRLELTFLLPRPKGHWGTGRDAEKLRPSAPRWPAVRPDLTKLIRSTEDALSGLAWRDDAQIVEQIARKVYCVGPQPPGAWIMVCRA